MMMRLTALIALLAVVLAAVAFLWLMAGRDAGYAWRVLYHRNSSITDFRWKERLPVDQAASSRPWPVAADAARLDNLPTDMAQSILIVHNGQIVCEWYGNGGARDRAAPAFSVSKTVVSLLLARAIADGDIAGLETPVIAGIPELGQRDPRTADITLADLIDMRSGLAFSEAVRFPWVNRDYPRVYYATDLAATVVRHARLAGPPGNFQYNDYAPNLVGLAAYGLTGTDLVRGRFAQLWNDLGAEYPAGWSTDKQGFAWHESGLIVTARDLARIGQLILDGGRSGSMQVAPQSFVERSLCGPGRDDTVTSFLNVPVGYRNGWWLLPRAEGAPDLAAMGAHGQIMVVSPMTRTVLVRMGDDGPLTNIQIATALQRIADQVASPTPG